MLTIIWRIRCALEFRRQLGAADCTRGEAWRLAGTMVEQGFDDMHPMDAVAEEISYWVD